MKKIKPQKPKIIILTILIFIILFAVFIQQNPYIISRIVRIFNPNIDNLNITFEKADYYGFEKYDDKIVAAYRDNIKIYDKYLNEKQSILVAGSDPTVKTNGENMIVFYPTEKKAYVKTNNGEKSINTSYYILNATINKNGYYALVTEEKGFKSQVIVYNNDGEELYKWHSSDYYITDVNISPDNKMMVVTSLVGQKDLIKSCVMVFSFTENKPISKIEKTDNTIINTTFIDKNRISVIGDKKSGIFNIDLTPVWEEDYSSKQLFTYNVKDDNIVLALANTASATDKVTVKIFSASGKKRGEYTHNGEIIGLDVSDDGILAYSKRELYVLKDNGKVKRHLDLNVDILGAYMLNDESSVFVVSNSVGKFYYLR